MSTDDIMQDLVSSLEIANGAVAAVEDQRLREIAFGRILDYLLASKKSGGAILTEGPSTESLARKLERKKPSKGASAWLRELTSDGFFTQPRSLKEILQELSNRSHHLRRTDLTSPLQHLCHDKVLRRRKQAAADSVKEVFHWSNWC